MKLAVIGSRDFTDADLLTRTLDAYRGRLEMIVSGGAKGADQLAADYARSTGIPLREIRPEYGKYPGRAAPAIRNKAIIEQAQGVVAFWDGASPGTRQAIEYAQKAGKNVEIVHFGRQPVQQAGEASPGVVIWQANLFDKPLSPMQPTPTPSARPDHLPIIAAVAHTGEMGTLRFAKNELKAGGYPEKETREVMGLFLPAVVEKLKKHIPDNAQLILMPSTTGKNIIPRLLAEAIAQLKPGVSIHNGDFKSIAPLHQTEGKIKGDYLQRMQDPFRFGFTLAVLGELRTGAAAGRPAIIVDDITNAGEQLRALTLQLRSAGVKVAGVAALRASKLQYPTEAALTKVYKQIEPHLDPARREAFKKDFNDYFAPFPSPKLTRFSGTFNTFTDYGKVATVITAGAAQLRELASGPPPLLKADADQTRLAQKTRGPKL
jgi:hypothetical protein